MKNSIKLFLFCTIILLLPNFAFGESITKKAMLKDANIRNLVFLEKGNDYSLFKDKDGKFYLYFENWPFGQVSLYGGNKEIDDDHVVYRVDMGFFDPTYFYVKPPEGNFYSVSTEIETISASESETDDIIDEL